MKRTMEQPQQHVRRLLKRLSYNVTFLKDEDVLKLERTLIPLVVNLNQTDLGKGS